MKRLLQILIILFVFYYLFQIILNYFDKGYEVTYTKNSNDKIIYIKEKYSSNIKNEKDNYYLEITVDNNRFTYKTYENLYKMKNIVEDIKYIDNGNYKCILPIFKNKKILFDITCNSGGNVTYYHNIKGTDATIDEFANNIYEYNVNDWIDSAEEVGTMGNIYIYEKNLTDNIYIGLTSYKNVYNIHSSLSKNIVNIPLFENDPNDQKISAQVTNYYLVADYNQIYEFNKFYLVDLLSKDYKEIVGKNKISFNSYVQGVVGNSVYLIDIDNKKQYEVDIKSEKIIEIGNESLGIKHYHNGVWEEKKYYDVVNNLLTFDYVNIDYSIFDRKYSKVERIGGEKSGYFYLYEKNGNLYNVYKSYVEQPNDRVFLFTTNSIDNVIYLDNIVVFIENQYVKYYSETMGLRKLIRYDELQFNKNINLVGYYK